MDSKPFWQSKRFWTNTITPLLAILSNKLGIAAITGEEVAALLVAANLVLIFVSKGKVTLT